MQVKIWFKMTYANDVYDYSKKMASALNAEQEVVSERNITFIILYY